ncbi:MAG: hypothetical protein A3I66_15180 [Burkholderiales bacterium RIFCSPLOWO2_02_FULL_57_36]|nr:MAG: hypothetical protein A3I66_15180 [Burkholderiales bacterium RIFCSPLOWO2_02_FULL_57_36]
MKWIMTFLVGALCGAGALAYFLDVTPSVLFRVPAAAPPLVMPPPPIAMPAPPAVAPTPAPVIVSPSVDILPAAVVAPAPPLLPEAAPPAQHAQQPERVVIKPTENLMIPVAGIKASQLMNTFDQARGSERRHEAIDILAPKGTKVFAVADGKVVKLFNSKAGGLTLYQFDVTEKFAYYYAHLDSYAASVTEGTHLYRGDLVGYVGSTGNANPAAPHLHFAIFELTSEKKWWKGTPINPYPLLRQ